MSQWHQIRSVAQSCPTLCDPMNRSTPGLPVHHRLPEFTHSRPSSQWCHPAISFSVVPFSCPPVVMYGSESWTIKKTKHRRIDAFKLWSWRRLLRVPWTAKSSQSILKEINPEYSLEGLMLKLKLQYFSCLMWRADSLEKTLMLRKIESKRRRGWQRRRWMDDITDSRDLSLSTLGDSEGQGSLACCSPWGRKELDTTKWLNWTEASFNFMAAVTIWSDFGAPK